MSNPLLRTDATATAVNETRHLTIYLNSIKRTDKAGKKQDAFIMIDDKDLIELADVLLKEGLEKPQIATVILNAITQQGNVNMTFGNETKQAESKFDIAGILASLKK